MPQATVQDQPIERTSSRVKDATGRLLAKAHVARVGVALYDAAELGVGPKGQIVSVYRTPESIFHPLTQEALRGAPITVGHPKRDERNADGFVLPEKWRDLTVGNLVGEPFKTGDDLLSSDIIIGDKNAIDELESGKSQVSIGYKFDFNKADDGTSYDYVTDGPLAIDHVAVVEKGRAGSEVRVLDHESGEENMTPEEIQKAIQDALPGAIQTAIAAQTATAGDKAPQVDVAAITKAVGDSLAPTLEQMQKVSDDLAEAQKAEAARQAAVADEAAKKAAADSAAAFEAEIVGRERGRAMTYAQAMALIPQDKRAELSNATEKDILVAAVGDSVPDAANKSEDYLRASLDFITRERENARTGSQVTGTAVARDEWTGGRRSPAYEEYVKNLTSAYKAQTKEA